MEIDAFYKMPKIYGKDPTAAQILIYGQPLGLENQMVDSVDSQRDSEAVAEQLRAMGIYIN